jgi:hypothetical protein
MALRKPLVLVDGRPTILPSGDTLEGSGGGATQVYVQDTNPSMTTPGIWIETGVGPGGTGFTFWFEDGL